MVSKVMSNLIKRFFGEVLGTFIFILVALGSVAQVVVAGDGMFNGFLNICVGFGMGATIAIYLVGKISGANLNPAASLALCITGRLEWVAFPVYCLAQHIGAFLAAGIVYATYSTAIKNADPNLTLATAGIFATYPNGDFVGDHAVSNGILFLDQIIGTMILVLAILAVTDSRNKVGAGIAPPIIGMSISAVGLSFGYNCGFSLNPARDLGPRIFSAFTHGSFVFSSHDFYFWVPVLGPFVGGALAAGIYKVTIDPILKHQEVIEMQKQSRRNEKILLETY